MDDLYNMQHGRYSKESNEDNETYTRNTLYDMPIKPPAPPTLQEQQEQNVLLQANDLRKKSLDAQHAIFSNWYHEQKRLLVQQINQAAKYGNCKCVFEIEINRMPTHLCNKEKIITELFENDIKGFLDSFGYKTSFEIQKPKQDQTSLLFSKATITVSW